MASLARDHSDDRVEPGPARRAASDGAALPLDFVARVVPPGSAALVILLALLVALLEGVGVFLLIPLLALVGVEVGSQSTTGIAALAAETLRSIGIPVTLIAVLALYITIIAVQSAIAHAGAVAGVRFRETVAARMRHLLYGAIARMRWRAFIERHSSHYVHALTSQMDRAHLALSNMMTFMAQAFVALVYAAIALRIAPALSGVALVGGLLLVRLGRRHSRAVQLRGHELNEATARLHKTVVEHLSNMKVAKSFGAERQHVTHFEEASRGVFSTWAAAGAAFAGARLLFTIGAAVLLAVVVYAAVSIFRLDAAAILVLLYVFGRLVPRTGALQQLMHQILHALPALRATAAAVAEYERSAAPVARTDARSIPLQCSITFRDVSFGYTRSDDILRKASFRIDAGRITVLTGSSGAGKTTIADLLLGLLEPDSGTIHVDGEALSGEVADAWRYRAGYVPQDSILFDDTIRNNLLWAAPEADDAAMRSAISEAQGDFVFGLPDGLDTVVGERGTWLSGGERQRLAIARALLRRPGLLVLDEPTSSLDTGNERRILEVLRSLRGTLTIVLISHREAALSIADHVLVVEQGSVTAGAGADVGPHAVTVF